MPAEPDGFRHVEQHFGVAPRLAHLARGRLVAGVLRGHRQRALQPPGERMEPEDRAVDMREERHERIAACDVGVLVREDGGELVRRPFAPRDGEQDARRHDAGGHRRGDRRRFEDGRPVVARHADGAGDEAPRETPAGGDADEEEQRAGGVKSTGRDPPVKGETAGTLLRFEMPGW